MWNTHPTHLTTTVHKVSSLVPQLFVAYSTEKFTLSKKVGKPGNCCMSYREHFDLEGLHHCALQLMKALEVETFALSAPMYMCTAVL